MKSEYEIEDYSKERAEMKRKYPTAYWRYDDQSILPQNLDEINNLDFFENEAFYVLDRAIEEVEKTLNKEIQELKNEIQKLKGK